MHCILGPACNVKCMSPFWPPRGAPQATGTHDLHHYELAPVLPSSKRVQRELPARLSSQHASEFGISTQLNLTLHQSSLSSFYTRLMGIAVCLPELSSSSLSFAFHLTILKQQKVGWGPGSKTNKEPPINQTTSFVSL